MIRPARPSDSAAIARVHAQSWAETYTGLVPEGLLSQMTNFEGRQRQWEHLLAAGKDVVLVAEQGGQVVGFASAGEARDHPGYSAELFTLYLLKEAQGQRLGKALLQEQMRQLATRGHRNLALWVLDSNPTRGWYTVQGADEAGEKVEGPLRELRMVWDRLTHDKLLIHSIANPPIILEAKDFKELNLEGQNLDRALLSKKDLQGSHFRNTNLREALLEDANISFCDFRGSVMVGLKCKRAQAKEVVFSDCFCPYCEFMQAKLTGACFDNTDLEHANFTGAALQDASFANANLLNTDFSRSNLKGANLHALNLETAILEGIIYDTLTQWPEGFLPPLSQST